MAVQTYNFPDHVNNDTFQGVTIQVIKNSSPWNISDGVVRMQLRREWNTPVVLELSSVAGSITITDPMNGIFVVNEQIISVATPLLYKYDIDVILLTGERKTYISGTWNILPDITRG